VVVNAGNAAPGLIIDQIESHLPFEFVKVNHEPDGTFPTGFQIPCCSRTSGNCGRGTQQQGRYRTLRGMVTTTGAFSSTSTVSSSRVLPGRPAGRSVSQREARAAYIMTRG